MYRDITGNSDAAGDFATGEQQTWVLISENALVFFYKIRVRSDRQWFGDLFDCRVDATPGDTRLGAVPVKHLLRRGSRANFFYIFALEYSPACPTRHAAIPPAKE